MRAIKGAVEYNDYVTSREAEFLRYETFLNKVEPKYPIGFIKNRLYSSENGRRVFGRASLYVNPYLEASNYYIMVGTDVIETSDVWAYSNFHVVEELYDWFLVAYGRERVAVDLMLDKHYVNFDFNVGSGNNKCCISVTSKRDAYSSSYSYPIAGITGFGYSDNIKLDNLPNPTQGILNVVKQYATAQTARLTKKVSAMQKTIDKNLHIIQTI